MPVTLISDFMDRRLPRPEDVSRHHIDATVMDFLKGERDADWTEVSLLTLHPREEIRLVFKENADRYRTLNRKRFESLLAKLRSQQVAYSSKLSTDPKQESGAAAGAPA